MHLVDKNENTYVQDGIFIKDNQGVFRKYLFCNILWLEASGNYSYIHITDKKVVIVVKRLSVIENYLPKECFFRIHRSCIVNINSVEGFVGNMLIIGTKYLSVSPPYRDVMNRFVKLTGDG